LPDSRRKIANEPVLKNPLLFSFLSLLAPAALSAAEPAGLAAARALFDANRPVEARRAFEALAATDPSNADVHYYLGRLALERDDPDMAVRELETAESIEPGSARDHLALGDAYGYSATRAGMFGKFNLAKKCLAEFQRASELDPGNLDVHSRLLEFYSRAPWVVGGGFDKAQAEAAKIKELDPIRGHQAYASLYLVAGKYDLAYAEIEQALKAAPDDYLSLYQFGHLSAITGQNLDRGMAYLRRCLDIEVPQGGPTHSSVQWRIGNILEKKGDPTGARAAYEAALALNPKFTPASESLTKLDSPRGGG
jgi:tetratricopeptide (TPR) repeat protein